MHRTPGLCALLHFPLLCSHSSHRFAGLLCTGWCHGYRVSTAIECDMLYLCAGYGHKEGSQCERIFPCRKGQWQLRTTDPAFTQAILGSIREQGVRSHVNLDMAISKSQKSREIFRVCCAAKIPAQKILPPIEWPKLFQPIYFRIRSSTSWWPTLLAVFWNAFLWCYLFICWIFLLHSVIRS